MKCVSCGAEVAETAKFCTLCGTPVKREAPAAPVVEAPPTAPPIAPPPAAPAAPEPVVVSAPTVVIPEEYRLMGPWAYFGLQILYAIPVIGFIFLIIFSFKSSNLNRRNFTRSYWCALIVWLLIIIAAAAVLLATGAGAAILSNL